MSRLDQTFSPRFTRAQFVLVALLGAVAVCMVACAALLNPVLGLGNLRPWLWGAQLAGALTLPLIAWTLARDVRQQAQLWLAATLATRRAQPADADKIAAAPAGIVVSAATVATLRELVAVAEQSAAVLARQQTALAQQEPARQVPGPSTAYDPLTGAISHTALMVRLGPDVAFAAEHDRPLCLAIFDIDHFRALNTLYGYRFGDEVLFAVAERIRAMLSAGDLLARLNADHFVVVWPGLARSEAQPQVEAILRAVATEPLVIPQPEGAPETVRVTLRAGLVACPDDGVAAQNLVDLAVRMLVGGSSAESPSLAQKLLGHDEHPLRKDLPAAPPPFAASAPFAQRPADYIDTMAQKHSSIYALTSALESHDASAVTHARALADLAQATALLLNRSIEEARLVGLAALLHDVGSLGIPTEILTKAEPLSQDEWSFVREHPHLGERLLSSVGGVLAAVAPIVASHRERWDGGGYPVGLVGEAIPLGARIVAVCDVYGALISERPYRQAFAYEQAIAELQGQAGKHFDPQVVAAFIAALRQAE